MSKHHKTGLITGIVFLFLFITETIIENNSISSKEIAGFLSQSIIMGLIVSYVSRRQYEK